MKTRKQQTAIIFSNICLFSAIERGNGNEKSPKYKNLRNFTKYPGFSLANLDRSVQRSYKGDCRQERFGFSIKPDLHTGARLDGLPGCSPPWKMCGKRFRQTAKLALSLDLVRKISQHNHFRYFRHHFCSTFPRNPTKPMFRCFPMTPLMRSRFQHTCRWIWRFRGCLRHSPKGKKPNTWLQKTWYIRLSQSVFDILTMNF